MSRLPCRPYLKSQQLRRPHTYFRSADANFTVGITVSNAPQKTGQEAIV